MQSFTIMRKAVDEEGKDLDTWVVWEAWEVDALEAVKRSADIPATYYVYRDDPLTFNAVPAEGLHVVQERSEPLEVVQSLRAQASDQSTD